MGFLSTFTIWNDNVNEILKNKKEFAEKCYKSILENKPNYFNVGNLTIKLHQPKHADNTTIYVHIGNTVVEINPYSPETESLMKYNAEFFKEIIKDMEFKLKVIKKQFKESKESKQ